MRQLMVLQVPLQRPTPTVAPVIHWVVETGSSGRTGDQCTFIVEASRNDLLSLVAMITVMAEPSSMVKPREGECRVMRLPKLRMMLYPYVQRPMTIPIPPKALQELVGSKAEMIEHSLQDPVGDSGFPVRGKGSSRPDGVDSGEGPDGAEFVSTLEKGRRKSLT